MAQKRLVELVLKGKDESKGAFTSLENSYAGVTGKQALFAAGALAVAAGLAKAGQAVYSFVDGMATLGDEMDKVHERTGIAVKTLSELDFMIRRGGGSSADMETAVRRLARSMGDARDGIKEAVDGFAQLGSTADQLVGPGGELVDISIVLPMIADGLHGISSQASRMDIAQALLGRGGTRLLPALQKGAEGIREMRKEMELYGGAMSAVFSVKSAGFVDAQTNLANATERLKEAVAEPFLVPFTAAINLLAETVAKGTSGAKDAVSGGSRRFMPTGGMGWQAHFVAGLYNADRGGGVGAGTGYPSPYGNPPVAGPPTPTVGAPYGPRDWSTPFNDTWRGRQVIPGDPDYSGLSDSDFIFPEADLAQLTSGMETTFSQINNQAMAFGSSFAGSIGSGLGRALTSAQDFGDIFASILESAFSTGLGALFSAGFSSLIPGGGAAVAVVDAATKSVPSGPGLKSMNYANTYAGGGYI